MGYQEENNRKIEAAFQRLSAKRDMMVLVALTNAFKEAMDFAMELHVQMDLPEHQENGDDYGWMIVHNGVPVGEYFHEGIEKVGTAKTELQSLRWVKSDGGWQACLMAGMIAAPYKWDHEEEVLEAVEGELIMGIVDTFRNAWTTVKATK